MFKRTKNKKENKSTFPPKHARNEHNPDGNKTSNDQFNKQSADYKKPLDTGTQFMN